MLGAHGLSSHSKRRLGGSVLVAFCVIIIALCIGFARQESVQPSQIMADARESLLKIEFRRINLERLLREQTILHSAIDRTPQEQTRAEACNGLHLEWPVEGGIRSYFGFRMNPISGAREFHDGIDIEAPIGSAVTAPEDSEVLRIVTDTILGRSVVLLHRHGYTSILSHLSESSVQQGDSLRKGARIGLVGSSGGTSGPHLHFALHFLDEAVNPQYYLPQRFSHRPTCTDAFVANH